MNTGEGALGHHTRQMVYNYILTHPGATLVTIKRFFSLNESTLKYHLHYLERSKEIFSKRESGHRCYYCNQRSKSDKNLFPQPDLHALTTIQHKLLNLIQDKPGITNKELINFTKLNRKNLSYNLKRLSDLKLIWQVKNDGLIGYEYVTKEKLRDEIFNQLVLELLANEIDEETFHKIKKKLEMMDLEDII